jgi:hypothetical protein
MWTLFVTGACFALVVVLCIIELFRLEADVPSGIIGVLVITGSYYFTYLLGKNGIL